MITTKLLRQILCIPLGLLISILAGLIVLTSYIALQILGEAKDDRHQL